MSNAMRKGSLLFILAVICAATLVGSPVKSHAATTGGETSWTDDSPGGGTTNGDPDKPDPNRKLGTVRSGPVQYLAPRESASSGYSVTMVSDSLRGWMSSLYWAMRLRLGL